MLARLDECISFISSNVSITVPFSLACVAGGFVFQTHLSKVISKAAWKMALCTCGLGAHQPSKLKFLLGRHLATNSFSLGRLFYKSSHQLQNFKCSRNQNGWNLEGCSLNFFCVHATKQPAMQATFLLELFKNINSWNHCIVLLSLYKFIKLNLIYHCFLTVSATIQGEFRVSCPVQTMLEPGSQPSEITCSELTEKCYCSSLSKQGKLATLFTVPVVVEV